uniref:Similar to metalloprotease n=2 Tax=Nonomuraea gerenzanensis TaxID=93944 RepID=A0A1M4EGF1_9ACTN|nr:similar to metalloprotease [Nonomuraea gerenzanensis]
MGLALLCAPALAEPVKGAPDLTHNALYKAAALPKVACKLTKGTSAASTRKYITRLVGCLNAAWKPAIKGFVPVKVVFKDADDKESCSTGMDVAGSFSEICATQLRVRLADDWIKAKNDLTVFTSITRTWGGVVTGQTGIGEAWWGLENDASETVMNEHNRRYYLQLDCFVGVSAKAVGRQVKDWKPVVKVPEFWKNRFHGKTANRLYWSQQGYKSGKPGACNTWKASSAKVA